MYIRPIFQVYGTVLGRVQPDPSHPAHLEQLRGCRPHRWPESTQLCTTLLVQLHSPWFFLYKNKTFLGNDPWQWLSHVPRFPLCLEKNTAIHFWGLDKTLLSRPSTHYLYMQHNQDIHEVSIHICLFGHMTLASDKYITFRPQARSALILRPPPLGQQEKK